MFSDDSLQASPTFLTSRLTIMEGIGSAETCQHISDHVVVADSNLEKKTKQHIELVQLHNEE